MSDGSAGRRVVHVLVLLAASVPLMASVATAAQVPVWPAASELTQPVNALASGARFAQLASVTCPSVGNCTAVGSFTDSGGLYQPMVATEVGGVWGRGRQLSLPANASASSPSATLLSVACTSAGNCVAVGSYNVVPGLVLNSQPMVITEVGGVWGQATQLTLPANAAAPSSQLAGLRSVSCAAAGSCVAVGHYIDSSGAGQAMVATAANGLWAPSTELALPSDASLAAQNAGLGGVACASPANCVAVGYYVISSNVDSAPMVANETGGVWAPATRIALPPGAATALQSQIGGLDTVTCPAAGNCVAGGYYADTRGFADLQAMTVAQTSGVWAQSVRLKLPANLSTAASTQNASVNDISCRSVGTCVAVGVYRTAVSTASQFDSEAMVATETAGAWAHATQLLLPADAVAGSQFAPARGVSCPAPSRCSAVGSYIVTGANSPISPMVADSVGSLSIPTTSLPWGRVGSRYRGQLAGAGGSGGYGWAITGGSLPKGLRLDPRLGLITGTPRTSGWAHFTVSLADSGPPPQTVTRPLALNVMAPRRPGTALRSSVISARHRSARFSFVATGVSTGFQCALQGISHGPSIKPHFTSCRSPKTYTRLRPGSYVFSVAATGPAGPDPTPATRTFTINGGGAPGGRAAGRRAAQIVRSEEVTVLLARARLTDVRRRSAEGCSGHRTEHHWKGHTPMTAADTPHIRVATDHDAATLDRLAAHHALRPLEGPVLIAERNGMPVAALSLADGRLIADDSSLTEELIACLRIQAIMIWSRESEASLADRIAVTPGVS